jgi:hypothetical protein
MAAAPSTAAVPLHVETRLRPEKSNKYCHPGRLAVAVRRWLHDNFEALLIETPITYFGSPSEFIPLIRRSLTTACTGDSELLTRCVDQLFVSEIAHSAAQVVQLSEVNLHVHVYRLHQELASDAPRINKEGAMAPGTCRIVALPATSLEGLWDSYVCTLYWCSV